jgi:hypothetical protein
MKVSQLRQVIGEEVRRVIGEEIQQLQENVKRQINRGEWVDIYDKSYGKSEPLTIMYMNSNKVGIKRESHRGSLYDKDNMVNIRDLSTMPYYKDLLLWIKTGDDSHIAYKTYEGLYDTRFTL